MTSLKNALRGQTCVACFLLVFGFVAVVHGAVFVTSDHVVSGSVVGKLVAIDTPYIAVIPTNAPLGPGWVEAADDGWRLVTTSLVGDHGMSPWEPDGTDIAEAKTFRQEGKGTSTYTFNLSDWGIAFKDGLVINAVYATWLTRNASRADWSYTEGTNSGLVSISQVSPPVANLKLQWTDSASGTYTGSFQRIFNGPIVVADGNGFKLTAKQEGNSYQCDAVVLDVSFPPAGIVFVIR